jgi:hypothetical protein
MKENRSLELSIRINKKMQEGLLGPMEAYFPEEIVDKYLKKDKRRDRLYNLSSTVRTMIASAIQEDKTLQNAVLIFKDVLTSRTKEILKEEEEALKKYSEEMAIKKRAGRPRTKVTKIAKSKLKDISLSTSSYTTARQRVPVELMEDIFEKSRDVTVLENNRANWHGRDIYISDGTYLQLQDSSNLREKYACQFSGGDKEVSYPQALLEVIIHQRSGCIFAYALANRSSSELNLVPDLMKKIPNKQNVLLADDLYNCYAIFCIADHLQLEMVVPAKRQRKYSVKKNIAKGDDLITICETKNSKEKLQTYASDIPIQKSLTMRRISYTNPAYPNKECVLLTSILDESIDKSDIMALYTSRWDIELSIREFKTIMHINTLRSKTDDMIHKELASALIAYNFIRKIIHTSAQSEVFPPQEDFFYDFYSFGKTLLVDKFGRVYRRWSSGRPKKSSPVNS